MHKNTKQIIANVISESLEQDYLDKKYRLKLDSHNCLGMLKSDIINTNLKRRLNSDKYIVYPFQRSVWEGRYVIDIENKAIVSITSISNLKRIPQKKDRKIPHYMQTTLYCINNHLEGNKQISILDFRPEFQSEVYIDDLSNIFKNIELDTEEYTYYVVAYDYKSNKLIDLVWYLLDPQFNVVSSENIMGLIEPDHIDLTKDNDGSITTNSIKDEKPRKGILLGLKQEKIKTNAN